VMKSRDFAVHQAMTIVAQYPRRSGESTRYPTAPLFRLAFVLKGQLQSRSELESLCRPRSSHPFSQPRQCADHAACRRGLHRSLCRILPGLCTRADYFRYSVD
jgi:hypothetical protein